MASTIQGNVARTRHNDPTTHHNTAPSSTQGSDNGARLQFRAERDRDTFVRAGAGSGGGGGRLEGFDHGKLNDPQVNTPKYIVGRILQNYPNTPEGLRQAIGEIQRHFPEARIVPGGKGDVIDFGSHTDPEGRPLGRIDVIRAAGGPNGGEGWQWLPINSSNGAGVGGAGAGGGPSAPNSSTADALLAFLQSPEGRRILELLLSGMGQFPSGRTG
jgi:hypothetical protein